MVDLKMLGRSLAESGLMDKSFAVMSEAEARQVARLVLDYTKKRCIHCDQWEKAPESPWWIGKCYFQILCFNQCFLFALRTV